MHPSCPIERTVRSEPLQYVTRVEGCGVVEDWHYVLDPNVRARWMLASNVRARAAIEFECDASMLEVTTVAHEQIAVTGCGRRGIYVMQGAIWVANTASPQ